jgi:hypothetical protein
MKRHKNRLKRNKRMDKEKVRKEKKERKERKIWTYRIIEKIDSWTNRKTE